MFNEARKAVWAAVFTGLGAIYTIVQTATAADGISADEWGLIAAGIATFVATVAGVYRATNKPANPPA